MKDREEAAESLIAFGMRADIRAGLGRWLPPCIHATGIVSLCTFSLSTHIHIHPHTHASACHFNTKPVLLSWREGEI